MQFSFLWAEHDSNMRRRKPADLQSAPVDRFGIDPQFKKLSRNRDLNPGPLPYHGSALPLSYFGVMLEIKNNNPVFCPIFSEGVIT